MGFFYTVQQGDCLSSLAKAFGFPSFHTIYEDPQNATLRQQRPNPNVIFPGDQIYIPDKTQRSESAATDTAHTYQITRAKTLLRIGVVDPAGQPLRSRSYTLTVGAKVYQGETGTDGLIEAEIEADESGGSLVVAGSDPKDPPFARSLFLGHLDPITEVSGVQGRLNNLGFYCGEVDGIAGPATAAAVAAFQRCYGLQVDGVIGPATRDKLLQVHGS